MARNTSISLIVSPVMSPGPGRLDSVTRRRLFLSPLLLLVALLTGLGLNTSSASASAGPETRVRAINHVPAISVGNIDSETPGRVGYLRPETGQVMSGSCVATNTARGGAGPVLKGQAGVDAVAADIEAAGGKVLGREITVEAGGVRTRPDLFVEQPCGTRCFVEVKNGPTAGLTPNQSTAFPVIQSTGGVPVGANAAAAGLTPGVPIGPTPVWVVYLS